MKKQGTSKGWAYILLSMMLIGIYLTLTACKTIEKVEYVPVKTVKTEYRDRLLETYDSIHIHDSVFVQVKGDTIFKDRWKLVYKNRYVHDTAYVHRTDSIPVPYPVEKRLDNWEQFKVDYMGYITAILLAALATLIIYIRWRRKPQSSTSYNS